MLNRRELLTGAAAASLAEPQSVARPNILHIMSDQQQWATIAGRSQCRMPNLNRLAAGGMLFERSYTPSAVCCPARAIILSGAYHWHNGVFNQVHSAPSVHRDMFPDVVLYPQRLKEAGYRLGYVGKWHASWLRGPLQFGFDEIADVSSYRDAKRDNQEHPSGVARSKEKLRRVVSRTMQWPGSEPFPMWGHMAGPEEATPEHYRTDCAINVLNRMSKRSEPWHLEVHYIQPHDPYFPLQHYVDRYDPRAISVPRSFHDTFEGKPGLHRRESETWGHVTEDDYRQSRAHYFAYAEQLDAQIGRLLDALEKTGQANNTIVVCTTDHGDMVGAHRMWIKGWIPYEECYRVPMIVRWPGKIQPGSKTSRLAQTHDLGYTYLTAAGARPLPFRDGRALQPLFENPDRTDWTDQILCAYYGGEFLYTQRIAITGRFKYVFNGFDIDELYDLENDPEELTNVVASAGYRAHAGDMRARLYEMMNGFEDPYGTVAPRTLVGEPPNRYGAERYLPRGKRI
ncbi:MAG: sulfatase-like hydrolase/transferase [Bryobacteraceae bacterium]